MEPFVIIVAAVAMALAAFVWTIATTRERRQVREAESRLERFDSAVADLQTRLEKKRSAEHLKGFLKTKTETEGSYEQKKSRKQRRRRSRRKRRKQ